MDDWKKDLNSLFIKRAADVEAEKEKARKKRQEYLEMKKEVHSFFLNTVLPALQELKKELNNMEVRVTLSYDLNIETPLNFAAITLEYINSEASGYTYLEKFIYKIVSPDEVTVWIETRYLEGELIKAECLKGTIRSSDEDDIYSISSEDIIENFIGCYKKYIF